MAAVSVEAAAGVAPPGVSYDGPQPSSVAALDYVPGEVIVAMEPGVSPEFGVHARRSPLQAERVTVSVALGSEAAFIETLSGRPGVRYAELNSLAQPSFVPNDPEYPLQWGMPMIGAESAWDVTRGEGVTVAVVDTGVAFETRAEFARSPELLQTSFVHPYDATTGTAHPNDINGHGTHVAGTIAQDSNDGEGVAGIAPRAVIMPVQVCRVLGCPADAMADGVRWAVDHGANVINMSLGGPALSNSEREALAYAESRGVVVVAAAGNGGDDFIGDEHIDFPAAVPTVVSVGAVLPNGTRASYSNYGRAPGLGLHLVAPGGSTRVDSNLDGHPDGVLQNTYSHSCGAPTVDYTVFRSCFYHGTSMATPHVTGTVALMLSMYPSLTPADVRTILRCSALDFGPHGHDPENGAGLVRADVALRDTDRDDVPDCLEEPTSLLITVGSVSVPKGQEFSVPVRAFVEGQGISGYNVTLSYEPELMEFVGCSLRSGGVCNQNNDSISLSGSESPPLAGEAKLAEVRFRSASDQAGVGTLLLAAGASPASPSDPGPVISVQPGQVYVLEATSAIQGDVDCSGVVSGLDLILILKDAGGGVPGGCVGNGDVDCSGVVDALDAYAMARRLAVILVPPPVGCLPIGEGPEATPTPTG